MCGQFGLIRTTKDIYANAKIEKFFANALYVDALRGPHATGVFTVEMKDKAYKSFYAKDPCSAPYFLGQKRYAHYLNNISVSTRVMVGHNRYATVGSGGIDGAHPHFHGPVIMVHNGTLEDYYWLPEHPNGDSDSARLCSQLKDDKPGGLETWRKVKGAYACVWYDNRTQSVYMVRNDARPLQILENNLGIFFASEGKMLPWLLDRHDILNTKKQPKDVPIHTLLQFRLTKKGVTQVKPHKFTPPRPRFVSSKSTGDGWWSASQDFLDFSSWDSSKDKKPPKSTQEQAKDTLLNAKFKTLGLNVEVGEILECVWASWTPSNANVRTTIGTVSGFVEPECEDSIIEAGSKFEGTIYVQVRGAPYNEKAGPLMETCYGEVVGIIDPDTLDEESCTIFDPKKDLLLELRYHRSGNNCSEHKWRDSVLHESLDGLRWAYSYQDIPQIDTPVNEKLTLRETDLMTEDTYCLGCGKEAEEVPTKEIGFVDAAFQWKCLSCRIKTK